MNPDQKGSLPVYTSLATEVFHGHHEGLSTFVIGFGKDKIEMNLKNLAFKAKGEYIQSIDSLQLKKSFLSISSVLGAKISVAKSSK